MKVLRNTSLGIKRDSIIKLGMMSTYLFFWFCNHQTLDYYHAKFQGCSFVVSKKQKERADSGPIPYGKHEFLFLCYIGLNNS